MPQNYPLLLSIIRNHFIEGHRLQISQGADASQIDCQYYKTTIRSSGVQVDNGIIYAVDRLVDPFASVFGVSPPSEKVPVTHIDTTPRQEDKTMTDLVQAEPRLSQWTDLMKQVLSAILKRLGDRRGPEGVAC